jgi:hypothetical protein
MTKKPPRLTGLRTAPAASPLRRTAQPDEPSPRSPASEQVINR